MKYRSIISLLLIVATIANFSFVFLNPAPVHATIKSSAIQFTGCTVGSYAAAPIKRYIDEGIKLFKVNAETFIRAHFPALARIIFGKVLGGAIGGVIGITVPVYDAQVQSQVKSSVEKFDADWLKKYTRDDIIARCFARTILNNITGNTTEIIRTGGRDGGVTFVKNWVNFETGAQYRGENIFRAELSTAHLCDYLASDFKKAYGVDPKTKTPLSGQNTRSNSLQPFNLQANCTLPAGFTPQKYQEDFAGNGGWDTYSRLLDPQNNAWGLAGLSQNEITQQRTLAVKADTNQVVSNNGYLGISGNGKADSCLVKGATGDCLIYKDVKTPGSYLATNVAASVTAEIEWLTSVQGLGTILANATEVMLNRLLDFGSSDEGSYRYAGDIDPEGGSTASASEGIPEVGPQTCVADASVKSSITQILTDAQASLNTLNISDFEDTFGSDRGGGKKNSVVNTIGVLYTRLYAIEKTLTAPNQQDLKNIVQGYESILQSIIDSIPNMQWNTQVEQVSVDRQLTALKDSMEAIVNQFIGIPFCGAPTP